MTISIYGPKERRKNLVSTVKGCSILLVGSQEIKLAKRIKCIRKVCFGEHKTEVVLEKESTGKRVCLDRDCEVSCDYKSSNIELSEISTEEKHNTLESLLQHIYENGSDEVKRAMNKSFFESGGTVLSTKWGEVSKKKVNPEET